MDLFSQLNEDLVHSMIRRLPKNEAAQICLLSKECNQFWSSYTNFDFQFEGSRYKDLAEEEISKIYGAYCGLIRERLRKCIEQNQMIERFKLSVDRSSTRNNHIPVDEIVEHAAKGKPMEIDLDFNYYRWSTRESCYNLQPTMFFMANTIQVLKLKQCAVPSNYVDVEFPHLRRLKLVEVVIEEIGLANLLSKSPSIRSIKIWNCIDLNNIELPRLFPRLKKFKTSSNRLRNINIRAPNLEDVALEGGRDLNIEIESSSLENFVAWNCTNLVINVEAPRLKKVVFNDVTLADEDILDNFASSVEDITFNCCPQLSLLKFRKFPRLKKIKISSCRDLRNIDMGVVPNLEHMEVKNCDHLEIKIEAPKLETVHFSTISNCTIALSMDTSLLKEIALTDLHINEQQVDHFLSSISAPLDEFRGAIEVSSRIIPMKTPNHSLKIEYVGEYANRECNDDDVEEWPTRHSISTRHYRLTSLQDSSLLPS